MGHGEPRNLLHLTIGCSVMNAKVFDGQGATLVDRGLYPVILMV